MTISTTAPSRIDLPDAPPEQQEILRNGGVACWREPVLIDTYEAGEPDKYPLFLDRRVYQGSSGRIYPLPMIDRISHDKQAVEWDAIHLENEFVRLMLLPALGGRIHIGYDKVAQYDFFYRNNVIKPALVGLAGPWISGGVEFNWPQHHRPATYLPVDTTIEREDDGAVVVWHTDLDPLQRMRATHGVRLRPGSSVIEADVLLHNRTDTKQTFLWWANVAARSHQRYQSFFPDDVAYVADHARRAISAFPEADRLYYGVDYPALAEETPGANRIDFYGNIPVPTSYMITDTKDSFFGGYDHDAEAGFVHWADRAVSPGKKQWTWGDGPIGRAWDDQLTDDDGPYVELMAGVYTDNQPDFSWLLPGETKRFSQFWYPIHATGPARQASRDAAVSVDVRGGDIDVAAIATTRHDDATITVYRGDDVVDRWHGSLGPDRTGRLRLTGRDSAGALRVEVTSDAKTLVVWRERPDEQVDEPWVATAPPQPAEIDSNDELVLTATHLTQYRHPTRSAIAYLEEALTRDPADSRAATALGAWHLRRGEYDRAHELFTAAIARLTRRNLNPRDGEAHYLDGLALERLGRLDDANDRLARAEWNSEFAPAARLARARLALRRDDAVAALSLARDAGNVPEARRVAVLALRSLGRDHEAESELTALAEADTLDWATASLTRPTAACDPRTMLDVASEFARAGAYPVALSIAESLDGQQRPVEPGFGRPGPMLHYLRAYWLDLQGEREAAIVARKSARGTRTNLVFPAGLDHYDALQAATEADPSDHVAAGLLGMWLVDAGRLVDALVHLRAAADNGSLDPVVWRNLALTLVNAEADVTAADAAFVTALSYGRDSRLVLERDVLARVRGRDSATRLRLMEDFADLIDLRDDLTLQYVGLLMDVGRVDDAWTIIIGHTFRPFEGGEGQAIAAYDRASCIRAREALDDQPFEAIELLRAGIVPPKNLGEGRHPAVSMAERYLLLGDALAAVGDQDAARNAWTNAVSSTPLAAASRVTSEDDFWMGVSLLRLGRHSDAAACWERLDQRADEVDSVRDDVDYFATSLPELLLFDTDTAHSRHRQADRLRELAARGRALGVS